MRGPSVPGLVGVYLQKNSGKIVSGLTFRLLKLWTGISGSSNVDNSPLLACIWAIPLRAAWGIRLLGSGWNRAVLRSDRY